MTCREKLHIEHPGEFNEASGYITACPYTFNYAEEPVDCPYRDRTKRADPTSQSCQACWNREIPENNENQEGVVFIADELISKNSLMQAIRREFCLSGLGDIYIPRKELESAMVKAVVNVMPTIEAATDLHAYWKRQKMFPNACLYHCSNCEHPEMRKYNYCPNCGAKMDMEESR